MTAKGSVYINLGIRKNKADNVHDVAKVLEKSGWACGWVEEESLLSCSYESDNAGWIHGEVKNLEDLILKVGLPSDAWYGELDYTSFEGEVEDDGERVAIVFRDGKIHSFQESRVEMVECKPWDGISFDTTKSGDKPRSEDLSVKRVYKVTASDGDAITLTFTLHESPAFEYGNHTAVRVEGWGWSTTIDTRYDKTIHRDGTDFDKWCEAYIANQFDGVSVTDLTDGEC